MDPEIKHLYRRLYDRSDLGTSKPQTVLTLLLITAWLLCGLYNYVVLAPPTQPPGERAIRAVAFGPAYAPLDVARAGRTIRIRRKPVPTKSVMLLIGAMPIGLLALLLFGGGERGAQRARQRRAARKHAEAQGRPVPAEAVRKLKLHGEGLPLGLVNDQVVGIPYGADAGHVAVIAPTRSGKGLHLTETLLRWPGAAVVVDPKGEQWDRTAGTRSAWGPVYRLPFHGLDLLDYFDRHDPLDVQELHSHLLRPWQDREKIFAEKSLPLFHAAVQVGEATEQHPLRLLMQWADSGLGTVLADAQPHAAAKLAQFLDGDRPGEELNRFTQSAWGTFTTRVGPLVPHGSTVTGGDVLRNWAQQHATVYLTYPLDQLQTAGALVSAIVAGLIKGVLKTPAPERQPTLFAIDELPTVALGNLDTYLATIGGYGATALLYMQSLAHLEEVYGAVRSRAILANCHHQLYYAPRDGVTPHSVSELFGTELVYVTSESRSWGGEHSQAVGRRQRTATTQEVVRPALPVPQVLALPQAAVVLFTTLAGRQYRVLAERLNPIVRLPMLAPPPTLVRTRSWHVRVDAGTASAEEDGLGQRRLSGPVPGATASEREGAVAAGAHSSRDVREAAGGRASMSNDQDAYF